MGQRAKHPVAPTIRGAFLRALDIIEEEEGLTFSQLIHREIKEHGILVVMDKVARYTERTSDVNVNHSGETLVSILTGIAKAERAGAADSSVETTSSSLKRRENEREHVRH